MNRVRHRTQLVRNGSITVEVTVAVVLATTTLITAVQLVAVATRQVRRLEDRELAGREVANVMEDLMSRPWDTLVPGEPVVTALSPECQSALPDARLSVQIGAEEAAGGSRRISVQVDWSAGGPRRSPPVLLVAWRFPQ